MFNIATTFQVPKLEVLTYISCMDTVYVKENLAQGLHFWHLKRLVNIPYMDPMGYK